MQNYRLSLYEKELKTLKIPWKLEEQEKSIYIKIKLIVPSKKMSQHC